MLFLKIYIGFSLLIFILFLMQIYVTAKEFERDNPEYSLNNKTNIIEKLFHIIKIFLVCLIPFINIGMLWVVLFKSEELKEKSIEKVKKRNNLI